VGLNARWIEATRTRGGLGRAISIYEKRLASISISEKMLTALALTLTLIERLEAWNVGAAAQEEKRF